LECSGGCEDHEDKKERNWRPLIQSELLERKQGRLHFLASSVLKSRYEMIFKRFAISKLSRQTPFCIAKSITMPKLEVCHEYREDTMEIELGSLNKTVSTDT
jgi:hypothetical protein